MPRCMLLPLLFLSSGTSTKEYTCLWSPGQHDSSQICLQRAPGVKKRQFGDQAQSLVSCALVSISSIVSYMVISYFLDSSSTDLIVSGFLFFNVPRVHISR